VLNLVQEHNNPPSRGHHDGHDHVQFINAVAEKACVIGEDVDFIISAAIEVILSALISGEKVVITGFGTFEPREKANKGLSPTKYIGFKAGINLNDAVKGNYYDQSPTFIVYLDECIDALTFLEGSTKKVLVNAYERDEKAREICAKYYGYRCQVCEFDFEEYYGDIGTNFIHVHHLKPLSHIKKEYEVDPINDLRPVCPNCHAMLHTKNPPYTVEELIIIIATLAGKQQG
jgi:nucleoid DNA-binding protein